MTELDPKIVEVPENSKLPSGVGIIRGGYWFLVICGLLLFVNMITGIESANKLSVAETSFTMIINLGEFKLQVHHVEQFA